MSDKTANSFFMFPPVVKYAGFYQQLLSGIGSHQQLANRLIRLGEHAHSLRQFDKVKEIGLLLSNIPIKHYQAIGDYFLAVAANSMGNGDQNEARRLFELVVDTAPDAYKSKAILSLGALGFNKRDFDSALYYYRETIRSEKLGVVSLQAIRGIALLKSIEGYHKSAIADLEQILPIIRFAPSNVYFDFLNSYAVELSEVGRLQEAENVSSLVISSPLIHYYPEWQETLLEVRSKYKGRSTVFVIGPQKKSKTESSKRQARIIDFPKKEEPNLKDIVLAMRQLKDIRLTPMQMLGVLLKVALKDRITDEEVDRICSTYFAIALTFYEG